MDRCKHTHTHSHVNMTFISCVETASDLQPLLICLRLSSLCHVTPQLIPVSSLMCDRCLGSAAAHTHAHTHTHHTPCHRCLDRWVSMLDDGIGRVDSLGSGRVLTFSVVLFTMLSAVVQIVFGMEM